MDRPASIIFIHGPSSSGKSTLARAVQAKIDRPFWNISIDHLRDAGVLPSARIKSREFNWRDMRRQFFDGFHQSLAAYARCGNSLIVEHILDGPGWHDDLIALLAPFDVFFVGVHCSVAELNRREAARGDREIGSAERDFHTIHQGLHYDFEVQSEAGVEHNVERLIAAWKARTSPSGFAKRAYAPNQNAKSTTTS